MHRAKSQKSEHAHVFYENTSWLIVQSACFSDLATISLLVLATIVVLLVDIALAKEPNPEMV